MQTYYSIISIVVNHSLQERIGVGIVLVSDGRRYFRFSEEKLTSLSRILSTDKIAFVKNYLRHLNDELQRLDVGQSNLLSARTSHRWSSRAYLEYLNKYANNLVLFSAPQPLEIPIDDKVVDTLFSKWIFESTIRASERRLSVHDIVIERLYPNIDTHVNLDVVLTQENFSDLFLPVEVNFIGRNGSQVIGQAIEFDKRNYDVENDLTRFGTLIKAVESAERQEGTYFVMGKEPNKQNTKQHQLWSQVRESSMFHFVDTDELQRIEQFIAEKGVEPYFEYKPI